LHNHLGLTRPEERKMMATAVSGGGASQPEPSRFDPEPPPAIMPLIEIERRAILEALAYTKGDNTMAAQLLGIGRTTLYRKLKEYRLDGPEPKQDCPFALKPANPFP
jgi:transcriptional regulator of acetoin/glycerol metabolism